MKTAIDLTEQTATKGINLVQSVMSLFPNNDVLIQFYASLNTVLFFAHTYRQRLQITTQTFLDVDMTAAEVQETGEELAAMLGVVIEVKIRVSKTVTTLEGML
ncbi:hypothetical protein [Pseudanabaena sp. PCC 6802]|uniref:hypothetical protein n=1 Tax=Pseudanabaena sp. PCC 6802 TaxID=118173 RepID=UPI0008FBF9C1|nr:hypothetical protein [Pseudanabaena sp. PCC 6802]